MYSLVLLRVSWIGVGGLKCVNDPVHTEIGTKHNYIHIQWVCATWKVNLQAHLVIINILILESASIKGEIYSKCDQDDMVRFGCRALMINLRWTIAGVYNSPGQRTLLLKKIKFQRGRFRVMWSNVGRCDDPSNLYKFDKICKRIFSQLKFPESRVSVVLILTFSKRYLC